MSRTTVYLAHPYYGSGLRPPWTSPSDNTERVRRLVAGVEATRPGVVPVFAHLRLTARDERHGQSETARSSDRFRARLILGSDGPDPTPVDALWVVGPDGDEVRRDVSIALGEGVEVVWFTSGGQAEILAAEDAALRRAEESITADIADRVLAGEVFEAPDFRGAKDVIGAYFKSSSWVLGGGAIDYERRAGTGHASGTGGQRFRDAAATVALRMVRAQRMFRELGFADRDKAVMRLRYIEGHSWRRVALALGWSDDSASEERARGVGRRARARLGRLMRAQSAIEDGRA